MQHTKLKRLVRTLKVPQYAAVGILESLWHLTAREAPEGNIGKLSNEDIAIWIDWDGDATVLIEALIVSGWIDEDTTERLLIHDWHEHADDATKKAIDRQRKKLADNGGNVQTSTDKTRLPEPLPEPVPEPKPVTKTLASTAIAVPAARGKLVCTLPLNTGDHEVFDIDVQEWIPLYPAVDIRQELRTMKGWLLGSPQRRKTKTGIGRFINAWFARAQNESRPGAGNGTTQGNHKPNAAVDRQRITHDAIRNAAVRRYGAAVVDDDGRGPGIQAEPDTASGHSGCVPSGMGGDSPEVRFDDFQGRTLEGAP